MTSTQQVAAGREIQRRTGRTFHVATRFLPRRVRHATYVLYGFFRVADEVVDAADRDGAAAQRAELARIREAVLGDGAPDEPILAAVHELCARHEALAAEIQRFLDAMERDVETRRYETYEELRTYMRGSAVAVAFMMVTMMDPDDPETARPHAAALGEAFQLTNFLRDVREDALERGRIYLPGETLRAHGIDYGQVVRLEMDERFAAAMRTLLARTERRYCEGVAGIRLLPADCRFPVLLAAVLYADHHRLIRATDYDVLARTPSLTLRRRLSLLVRTAWYWRRTGDPEATFHSVTDVSASGARGPRPGADPVPR